MRRSDIELIFKKINKVQVNRSNNTNEISVLMFSLWKNPEFHEWASHGDGQNTCNFQY